MVVVDLPPDELLARLKAGKVYLPQQAERAAANFFRKGNLLALRELALRRTADRVDDEMRAYRRASTTTPEAVWPNREALLACVGTGDNAEKVVRSCAAWPPSSTCRGTPCMWKRPSSKASRPPCTRRWSAR